MRNEGADARPNEAPKRGVKRVTVFFVASTVDGRMGGRRRLMGAGRGGKEKERG